jgi:hypothetical protein
MKCPTCPGSVLVMADRNGIEIDYCPTCRGVWLDRGELDKIIERATATMAAPAAAAMPAPASSLPAPVAAPVHDRRRWHDDRYDTRFDDGDDDDVRSGRGYKKKKRRESFLGELFDF